MNSAKLTGRWGEAEAARFLRRKKYKIIGMGYRTRFGEIDIIAENRDYVVFAEVKTRRSDSFAKAREYVDAGKRRRIIAAAQQWLAQSCSEKQPRFDVIEIYAPEGTETKNPVINHIPDAFPGE